MATKLEQKGRRGDKLIAHLTPGEIVIPRKLAEDDDFRAIVAHFMRENGADPEKFIAGSGKNSINPETGYAEFGFLDSITKPFKKAAKEVGRWAKKGEQEMRRWDYKLGFRRKDWEPPKPPKPIPSPPPLPPPSPVPTQISVEATQKERDRRRRRLRTSGRAGTILTTGTLGEPNIGRATLLGGSS